jgi:hypothetical protein
MKRRDFISIIMWIACSNVLVAAQTMSSNFTGPQAAAEKKPDLVAILRSPMNGEIRVKNIGSGPAGPSKLTLDCVRIEALTQMYSCPNLPVSVAQTYYDSAFPNNATITVPALAPSATFTHRLSFWDVSNWPKGKYRFTVTVDAAHALIESDTKNNTTSSVLTVP